MEDTKKGAASKKDGGGQVDIDGWHAVSSRENWGKVGGELGMGPLNRMVIHRYLVYQKEQKVIPLEQK